MQRFAIPTTQSSTLAPIDNAIDILSTQNTLFNNIELVATGPTSLLAVWSDNRWGTAREIYAAPIDVDSCP
jgi:hypothetical protein